MNYKTMRYESFNEYLYSICDTYSLPLAAVQKCGEVAGGYYTSLFFQELEDARYKKLGTYL